MKKVLGKMFSESNTLKEDRYTVNEEEDLKDSFP